MAKPAYDRPARSIIMEAIKDICGDDKELLFSFHDIDSVLRDEFPELGERAVSTTMSAELERGGYIKFVKHGKRKDSEHAGRGPKVYRITQKGIEADTETIPGMSHYLSKKKTDKKIEKPVEGVVETKTSIEEVEQKSAEQSPPEEVKKTMSEIERNVRMDMAKNLLVYIKDIETKLNAYEFKIEDMQLSHNRVIRSLKGELKDRERAIKQLNDTVIQLQERIKKLNRANTSKSASESLATLADGARFK